MKLGILIFICLILLCIDISLIFNIHNISTIIGLSIKLLLYGLLIAYTNKEFKGGNFLPFSKKQKIYSIDTFKNINDSLANIFSILDKNNMCFIGGALVIEDPENKIFNLLTYDIPDIDPNYKLTLSNYTNMIQTLTHSSFSDRFEPSGITPKTPDFIIPKSKCINNNFKCNKFERKIYIEKICKNCVTDDSDVEVKQSLLYYPFKDLNNNNYLYIKLESHPSISIGHTKAAIDTYVTKTRFNSDSKTCNPRRESTKDLESWKNEFKNKDSKYYRTLVNNKILDNTDLEFIDYYNHNIRSGNELFIPYSFIQKNKIFKDLY